MALMASEEGKNEISSSIINNLSRDLPKYVSVNMWVGGKFVFSKGRTDYVGGGMQMENNIWLSDLSMDKLRSIAIKVMEGLIGKVPQYFRLWLIGKGRGTANWTKVVECEADVSHLVELRDMNNRVVVYAIEEERLVQSPTKFKSKNPSFNPPRPLLIPKKEKGVVGPSKRHWVSDDPDVIILGSHSPESQNEAHLKIPSLITPTSKPSSSQQPNTSACIPPSLPSAAVKKPIQTPFTTPQYTEKYPSPSLTKNTGSPRRKHAAKICKPPQKRKPVLSENKEQRRKGGVAKKGKSKTRGSCHLDGLDSDCEVEVSSDSDLSDLDVNFELDEDDNKLGCEDDFGTTKETADILKQVQSSLKVPGDEKRVQQHKAEQQQQQEELDHDVEEVEWDSEDLTSLRGSDDEVDPFPIFNEEIDFSRPINLVLGLIFKDVYVCRKALQHHAIENHYDYYFLHNASKRITTYCRFRCSCPWDKGESRYRLCDCDNPNKCHFKIYARRMRGSEQFQLRTVRLHHACDFHHSDKKVTSEYLAERYLDEWKGDPNWKLERLIEKVYRDLGVNIKYMKAWLARARAKLILYGDASEEYKKVYDYANAILQHNPGSTAIVTVEGVESPPPHFQRFYVCLEAMKEGFRRGCRPLIGVDGCHLKGAFPGIILVAVSKDGNNNIFPVAWAIVEAENGSSWTWFLEFLMNDIGFINGDGLTMMSDRQKGLLEAMGKVVPNAEIRFCTRHIWANFKLKFGGQAFKDHFWAACRATTEATFNVELGRLRILNEDAYTWLSNIPAKHWARHAFSTNCKSNMLLNNLCETFNAVIRQARDKPVITCLEWIRRYVMKRNTEKYDGIQLYEGRFVPYVGKVLAWVRAEACKCDAQPSRMDIWEVDAPGDRAVVNLREHTCTCNNWSLTGIPCPHAYACILMKRQRPKDYVHEYYTKDKYTQAYTPYIKPMPGMKHWPACGSLEPLPPSIKIMPGRPSNKKRKKEAGEDAENKLRTGKKQKQCSNCRQFGHNMTKCKNPKVEKEKKKPGRPPKVNDPWVTNQRQKKKEKAAKTYVHPTASTSGQSSNQISFRNPPSAPLQMSQTNSSASGPKSSQPKQSKSSRPKLQTTSKAKKKPW